MRVLITCPPMLRMIDEFRPRFAGEGCDIETPDVVQTLPADTLVRLLPHVDGWIAGDDPAERRVLDAGRKGKLRAVVKWGVGVDNVDFAACRDLGIRCANTPGMFGKEVADIAVGYVIGLARETFYVDRAVRSGQWPKPAGISLAGRRAAVVGLGDIGRNIARRLLAMDMTITAYDPAANAQTVPLGVSLATWPSGLDAADFIVVACALNDSTRRLLDARSLGQAKPGVRVVNVARGPIIDEQALIEALATGQVHSAALDVFEIEPLPEVSPLRSHDRCILGSHNASNTMDAVRRTSEQAIELMFGFLGAGDA